MENQFGIKGFIPTSFLDWPGKVCSVVFLAGCGFRCLICHNARLVRDHDSLPDYPVDDILGYLRKKKNWIDGVTVSGGEPTGRKNLPELLGIFKQMRVRIKLDTNGSNPSMLKELVSKRLIDAVYMDVKAPLNRGAYSTVAGVPIDIRIIKRSIEILKTSDLEIVFRTTAIPGLIEEPQIREIKQFIGADRRFLLQFFRNENTLDPEFSRIEEFPQGRIDSMRAELDDHPAPARPLANAI